MRYNMMFFNECVCAHVCMRAYVQKVMQIEIRG